MWPRTEAALAIALALACGCAGCGKAGSGQEATVGHHRVRFQLPKAWERLDHGREQLFRLGEAQLTLVDLGPATADAMAGELERARALWLAGRRLDAFARVRELRSPALRYASHERRAEFWRPWTDVTYVPAAADSAEIGPAFDALIRGTRAFESPSPELLYQYVADRALSARGQEIAERERRTIHGTDWVVYQLWNRVSHENRTRVAFAVDDGHLLALTMDRGLFEQLEPAFESLLASIEVAPAPAR
jgi:hypothetical protein